VTITLRAKEVLCDPHRFTSSWRLAVNGILLFSDDEFGIFNVDEVGELDEQVSLRTDDPLAATRIRQRLPEQPPGLWHYFGRALIEASTRIVESEVVLHETVRLWLDELEDGQADSIQIRPHPWGWDKLL
jgi:hypothetical protein